MNKKQIDHEIIISMTSFPYRIANLKPVLMSIFSQTITLSQEGCSFYIYSIFSD